MPASDGPLSKSMSGPMTEPDDDMPEDGRIERTQRLIDALGLTGVDVNEVADALSACTGGGYDKD